MDKLYSLTGPQREGPNDFPESDYVKEFHPTSRVAQVYFKLTGQFEIPDEYIDLGYHAVNPQSGLISQADHRITAQEVIRVAFNFGEAKPEILKILKEATGIESPLRLNGELTKKIKRRVAEIKLALLGQYKEAFGFPFQMAYARAVFEFMKAPEPEGLGFPPPDLEMERERYSARYPTTGAKDEDCRLECTAEEALQTKEGWCTESTKVLFSVYQMAGFDVMPVDVFKDKDGIRIEHTALQVQLVSEAMGQIRTKRIIVDLSQDLFDAPYKDTLPISEYHLRAIHHDNLATDYAEAVHDPKRAFEESVRAVTITPDDPFLLSQHAFHLYNVGRASEAFQNLKKGIELNGAMPAHVQIALPHLQMGRLLRKEGERILQIIETKRRQVEESARKAQEGMKEARRESALWWELLDASYYYYERALYWSQREDSPEARRLIREYTGRAQEFQSKADALITDAAVEKRRILRASALKMERTIEDQLRKIHELEDEAKKSFARALDSFREAKKIDPRSSLAHTDYGITLHNSLEQGWQSRDALKEVIENLRRGIVLKPTSAAAHINLASVILDHEELSSDKELGRMASTSISEALKHNPLDPEAYRLKARVLNEERPQGAEQFRRQATLLDDFKKLPPWSPMNLERVAGILAAGRNIQQAVDLVDIGERAYSGGHTREAILFLLAAEGIIHDHISQLTARVHKLRGLKKGDQERNGKEIKRLEERIAALRSHGVFVHYHLGLSYLKKSVVRKEWVDEATKKYRSDAEGLLKGVAELEASRATPTAIVYDAQFYLGYLYEQSSQHDRAIGQYEKLLRKIGTASPLERLGGDDSKLKGLESRTLERLGLTMVEKTSKGSYKREELVRAREVLEGLLSEYPEHVGVRKNLITVLTRLQQTDSAQERQEIEAVIREHQSYLRVVMAVQEGKTTKLNRSDAPWVHLLGLQLSQALWKKRAVYYLRMSIRLNPDEPRYFYDLLQSLKEERGIEAVLAELRERKRTHPQELNVDLKTAEYEADRGNFVLAERSLDRVLERVADQNDRARVLHYRGWVIFNQAVKIDEDQGSGIRVHQLLIRALADFSQSYHLNPQLRDNLYYQGRSHLKLNQADQARRNFETFMEGDVQGRPDVYYFRARSILNPYEDSILKRGEIVSDNKVEQEMRAALKDLYRAERDKIERREIDAGFTPSELAEARGLGFLGLGLIEKGRDPLREVVDPNDRGRQNLNDAERYFIDSLRADPSNMKAVFGLSHVYKARGDRPTALLFYLFGHRFNEGAVSSFQFEKPIGAAALSRAAHLFEQIRPDERDKEVYHYYALSIERLYLLALEADSTHNNLRAAFRVLVEHGHSEEALKLGHKWAEADEEGSRIEDWEVFSGMGKIYRERKRCDLAVKYYEKSCAINRRNFDCFFWYVICLNDAGEKSRAVEEVEDAMTDQSRGFTQKELQSLRDLIVLGQQKEEGK